MEKLLPCPFCGTEAISNINWLTKLLRLSTVYCAHIECGAEQVRGTAEEVIVAWNTRAAEAKR